MPESTPDLTSKSGLSENAAGAIAYITPIPAIVFLLIEPFNKNSFVRFHSFQSILLFLAAVVIDVALSIFMGLVLVFAPLVHLFLWPLIQLFWLVVWIACIANAFMGKRFSLPMIGTIAEQQSIREPVHLH